MAEAAAAVLAAAFLLFVDILLNVLVFWTARSNRAQSLEGLPAHYGVSILLIGIFGHLLALVVALSYIPKSGVIVWPSTFFMAPAFFVAARMASNSFGARGAEAIFYTKTIGEATQFDEVERLCSEEDLEGAIAACDALIAATTTDPDPSFHKATLLEGLERPREAAELYETIRASFARNALAWRKATLRLADLAEHGLGDPVKAAELRAEAEGRWPTRV